MADGHREFHIIFCIFYFLEINILGGGKIHVFT